MLLTSSASCTIATLHLYGYRYPIEDFNDPKALVDKRPPHYSYQEAASEVYDSLMRYLKAWEPAAYAKIPKGMFI